MMRPRPKFGVCEYCLHHVMLEDNGRMIGHFPSRLCKCGCNAPVRAVSDTIHACAGSFQQPAEAVGERSGRASRFGIA